MRTWAISRVSDSMSRSTKKIGFSDATVATRLHQRDLEVCKSSGLPIRSFASLGEHMLVIASSKLLSFEISLPSHA